VLGLAVCPMCEAVGDAEGVWQIKASRIGSSRLDAKERGAPGSREAKKRGRTLTTNPSRAIYGMGSLPVATVDAVLEAGIECCAPRLVPSRFDVAVPCAPGW
jgi:hypothetical protein